MQMERHQFDQRAWTLQRAVDHWPTPPRHPPVLIQFVHDDDLRLTPRDAELAPLRLPPTRDLFTIVRTRTRPPSIWTATRLPASSAPAGNPPVRNRNRTRVRTANICVPNSLAMRRTVFSSRFRPRRAN